MIHSLKQREHKTFPFLLNLPSSFVCYGEKPFLKRTCKPKIRVKERSFDILNKIPLISVSVCQSCLARDLVTPRGLTVPTVRYGIFPQ